MVIPPSTVDQILATATISPEFAAALNSGNVAPPVTDITILKEAVIANLPNVQKQLAANRPDGIIETEHIISLDKNNKSRVIVCHKSNVSKPSPVIILFHGGGHCIGYPETEAALSRRLAIDLSATVICPSYRLAPENPFPAPCNDAWSFLKYLVEEYRSPHIASKPLLPQQADLRAGFIVGGISAGANLAAAIAHLARDNNLSPPITGQYLCAGTFMSPQHVPTKYHEFYLSQEQNKDAPLVPRSFLQLLRGAHDADPKSPLWACIDQHHPADAPGEVKHGNMNLPPSYFQACGLDIARDDSLIYERILREECNIPTKLDLYEGFSHCWWTTFPNLEMSQKRMNDSVEGIRWLLENVTRED